MSFGPNTRQSLVLRLQDADDLEAWDEFVSIYRPLVQRLAVKRGFQHADAEELSQEVMLSVSQAIDTWLQGPQEARFRPWLFTIARNLMVN